jgi:hypothetical protein
MDKLHTLRAQQQVRDQYKLLQGSDEANAAPLCRRCDALELEVQKLCKRLHSIRMHNQVQYKAALHEVQEFDAAVADLAKVATTIKASTSALLAKDTPTSMRGLEGSNLMLGLDSSSINIQHTKDVVDRSPTGSGLRQSPPRSITSSSTFSATRMPWSTGGAGSNTNPLAKYYGLSNRYQDPQELLDQL